MATIMAGIGSGAAMAAEDEATACPWIVQPEEPIFGLASDIATYEILFTGQISDHIFYGFSVADHRLARQLTQLGKIPDMRDHGRALKRVDQEGIIAYQVTTDSIQPRTIYLLAASEPMPRLEQIEARIDPARPIAVGLRTRGASDLNGPLPRRTVPGIEILASAASEDGTTDERSVITAAFNPDFRLCAYQVSWN